MADRRTVDLHEDDPEPIGHILHERRFAVAGRGNQKEESHTIGALILTDDPDLLRQVIAKCIVNSAIEGTDLLGDMLLAKCQKEIKEYEGRHGSN